MKSLWDERSAKTFVNDPLKLRVYTSQLLGQNSDLVLHGGGNTSVKMKVKDFYGDLEDILYVKGSGWDLATIKEEGFSPVKMKALLKMAEFKELSDTDMVNEQRAAMLNPNAPNPSVEAILHAIIPFCFVDHTHADSVVAISNTDGGEKKIREIYGDKVLIIPYVMPGFILARKVYQMTRTLDWNKVEGMILLHHGIFTFSDNARTSYEKMIKLVTKAEEYISKNSKKLVGKVLSVNEDLGSLAQTRKSVSIEKGSAVLAKWEFDRERVDFSNLRNIHSIAVRGPLTPDHVIRTKRVPLVIDGRVEENVEKFKNDYLRYFKQFADNKMTCLDPAPRWAVWKGQGTICFGSSLSDVNVLSDISGHTVRSIMVAEGLGGWKALSAKDIFDVEYWDLEQAKLKKGNNLRSFAGKIVLVTGAASGIGKACVEAFVNEGAVVAALDINPKIDEIFTKKEILPIVCDLTKEADIKIAVERVVRNFGGLDIVVSNAGSFPVTKKIADVDINFWEKSLKINLTSHQLLIKHSIPFLSLGIDPTIIIIGSKNVPAPGPGASSYSVAKAGLTQLARVAALELAANGIRVNVVHPNQVFDTGIWTQNVLDARAKSYGVSVEEYKKSNLLRTEITSIDVAALVCSLAGSAFAKTTGAQIPIDGGNERVI